MKEQPVLYNPGYSVNFVNTRSTIEPVGLSSMKEQPAQDIYMKEQPVLQPRIYP